MVRIDSNNYIRNSWTGYKDQSESVDRPKAGGWKQAHAPLSVVYVCLLELASYGPNLSQFESAQHHWYSYFIISSFSIWELWQSNKTGLLSQMCQTAAGFSISAGF